MVKTRVIPVLLRRGSSLVKGKSFDSTRSVGLALQAARIHQQRGVDELVILDVAAQDGPDIAFVKELTEGCFMPLTVGGGVRTLDHIRDLLASGADKVVIGTAAYRTPRLIEEASRKFGAQAITVAIDVDQHGSVHVESGKYPTQQWSVEYAKRMERLGAGEILLTSIPRDGTMEGYDLDLIQRVSHAVNIPVIAAGGCSGYRDMADAITAGAHAVAAGALFLFEDSTPQGAAKYLHQHGFNTRLAA